MSAHKTSSLRSGIQTSDDGLSYIPASKRADGSTRKEIRVRPGYRPPEDVEAYRNRSAEAWKNRGSEGVPGADNAESVNSNNEAKSKNAKRREAAKKKKENDSGAADAAGSDLIRSMKDIDLSHEAESTERSKADQQSIEAADKNTEVEVERQKKIRNQLKKLRAVRDLKEKKANGEKLSHDQLMKIGKEEELLRDLRKLNYDGPEMSEDFGTTPTSLEEIG